MGSCCITEGAELVLYDDREGWDGRREGGSRGRGHLCTLIHVAVQLKATQHCEEVILQLKNKLKKERRNHFFQPYNEAETCSALVQSMLQDASGSLLILQWPIASACSGCMRICVLKVLLGRLGTTPPILLPTFLAFFLLLPFSKEVFSNIHNKRVNIQ